MSTSSTNIAVGKLAFGNLVNPSHPFTNSPTYPSLKWENADHSAAGAVIFEPYTSCDLREDRVVLAKARVQACTEAAAALPHDDGAPGDDVAVVGFHAQPLRVRVAAVA